MLNKRIRRIKEEVLKKVLPTSDERKKVLEIADEIRKKVSNLAEKSGLECEVTVDGSVAKDTWLKGEADIDIFMRVPKSMGKREFSEVCLDIARRSVEGYEIIERYAEHPYIETLIDGYRINIVPCYLTEKNQWISSTDRTPFHTEYMKKNLDEELRNEVRILKKFMKAIGTYGAEIKVGGFSGMLCEVLILFYGSFENFVNEASMWEDRQILDIENYYKGSKKEIFDLFNEHLIVIDPVDKNRNVAAAVEEHRLWEFVSACRAFLENPSLNFFFPAEPRIISTEKIRGKIKSHGSTFLFLKFGEVDAVVDVLWSQLYKSERSLRNFLKTHDFNVLRSMSWSDERDLNMIVFEIEKEPLSIIKKHLGPQIFRKEDSDNFLKKHVGANDTVSGPWIEGNRWVVEKERKYRYPLSLLRNSLANGGVNIGIAKLVSKSLKIGFDVIQNDQILDFYKSNSEFVKFLVSFLIGKPSWMN